MQIVDSHCHLDFEDFKEDLEKVILNAKNNNVKYFQTICTKISEFHKIIKIIENNDSIYGSVGNHPHEIDKEGIIVVNELIKLTNHPKIIGIGETGLDYHYNYSDKNNQIESFVNHIKAARETALPIIIHTRNADNDTIRILKEEMLKGEFKGLIHCFTSTKELAMQCLDLGLYISVSGIVTFKNAQSLRDIIKLVPSSRLLIETDSPYLAPVPYRGKRNEPAFVLEVAKFLADLKSMSLEEFAKLTTDNFLHLFNKVQIN